jgi:hypothetical protein
MLMEGELKGKFCVGGVGWELELRRVNWGGGDGLGVGLPTAALALVMVFFFILFDGDDGCTRRRLGALHVCKRVLSSRGGMLVMSRCSVVFS